MNWIPSTRMGFIRRRGVRWTVYCLCCLLEICWVKGCWHSSPTEMQRRINETNEQNEICSIEVNLILDQGKNISEIRFEFERYRNTSDFSKINQGGDPCMCVEGFADGQNGKYEVQFYEENCFFPLTTCPAKPASVTCQCEFSSCSCNETDNNSDDKDNGCNIDGGNILRDYNTSDSRTCYRTEDKHGKRRQRSVENVNNSSSTSTWIFCICDNITKQFLCPCPDLDPSNEATPSNRPTTEATVSDQTTAITLATPFDQKNPNDEITEIESSESSDFDEGDLQAYEPFDFKCQSITTEFPYTMTHLFTTDTETTTTQYQYPTTANQLSTKHIVVIAIAGAIAIMLLTIVCVVAICKIRKVAIELKEIPMEPIETHHLNVENTATSNLDGYTQLNEQNEPVVNNVASTVYAEPDQGIRRRARAGQSEEHAYEDPNQGFLGQPADSPSNGNIPNAYEDIDSPNEGRYGDDPIPYESTDVHVSRQSRSDDVEPTELASAGPSNLPNSAFPPYAQVKRNPDSIDKQDSFEIERHTNDDASTSMKAVNDYGHLQPPTAADDGQYHKLKRGLNAQILDSAI